MALLRNSIGRFTLRHLPQRVARRLGWELRRLPASGSPLPTRPAFAETAAKMLGPHSVTIVDVGARWAVDVGQAGWYRVPPLGRLVGFEPDAEECARLNAAAAPGQHFVPFALGNTTGPRTLHLTVNPACASLYPPATSTLDRLAGSEIMRKIGETEVQVIQLDEWVKVTNEPPIVFMKLDVQGGELDVLKGGAAVLDTCLGLEIEVEFNELYQRQPLFAEIDTFLRARGFLLWRLSQLVHYTERALARLCRNETHFYSDLPITTAAGCGRLFWGHAVYLRDYQAVEHSVEGVRAALVLAALLDAAEEHDGRDACLRHLLTVLQPWLTDLQRRTLLETAKDST